LRARANTHTHTHTYIHTHTLYVYEKEKEEHDILYKLIKAVFLVVPHITDAIQEWVERVANQSVTEDGAKPEVLLIYELLCFIIL